ncbi:MAG: c-type cytochrome [Pelovirga sp.]
MAASAQHDRHDEHADGIVEDRRKAPPTYFYVLFYGLIIWGIGFSAYYLLSGWSSTGEFAEKMAAYTETYSRDTAAEPAPTPAATTSGAIDAAALYAANCAACHGAQGTGGFATDLTGAYSYGKDAESIRSSISAGRDGGMPAFADGLSVAEIDALVAYLQEL